jgi:hypothetical protein
MPRKPGRPPVDPTDRSVSLTLRLPSKAYDALCVRALKAHRSVAAEVRRVLVEREHRDRETTEGK